jgi:hypothetical protein
MARPTFKVTAKNKKQVAVAAGAGMDHKDIAAALGISLPTLRKHFKVELKQGANQKRLEVLMSLHAGARKGSASAARLYLALLNPPPSAKVLAGGPQGKKAQQDEDAKTAHKGTDWDGFLPENVTPIRKS